MTKFIVKPHKAHKPKLKFGDVIEIREGNRINKSSLDDQSASSDFVYFDTKEDKPEMNLFDNMPPDVMQIVEEINAKTV